MMETKIQHQTPWGAWVVLDDADSHKVKKVTIKAGQRLSYQKHFKREENWFIVQGKAKVTLDDKEHILEVGEFIHIPFEALHRIENIDNTVDLVFIEIQRGSYFGEDDIIRISDDYGRD